MAVDQDFWEHIWERLKPSALPGDLELLAFDLGMDATRQLTEVVRGRLYVPSPRQSGGMNLFGDQDEGIPPQLETVAEAVGEEVAQVLATKYGGTNLYIPQPESVVRVYRDEYLYEHLREESIHEVANRFDISTERVMQLIRAEGQQARLWDRENGEIEDEN